MSLTSQPGSPAAASLGDERRLHYLDQLPIAFAVFLGPGQIFDYVNGEYARLAGKAPGELIGRSLFAVFPELTGTRIEEVHAQVFQTGQAQVLEGCALLFQQNELDPERYFRLHVAPLTEEGRVEGVAVSATDVTASVQAQARLQESEARFRSLAESAPDIITRHGRDFRYLYVSPQVERVTGIPAADYIGKTYREMGFPEEVCHFFDRELERVFATGTPQHVEYQLPGDARFIYSRMVPEFNGEGGIDSVLIISTDETERRERLLQLKEKEEQLRVALEGGDLGHYDYLPEKQRLIWSAKTRELFGVSAEAEVNINTYLNAILPEDRQRNEQNLRQALAAGDGSKLEEEFRIQPYDGSGVRWLRSKGVVFLDEQGQPRRVTGVVQDVTEYHMSKILLEEANERLQAALHASGTGTFRWNIQTNELQWDENLDRLFGLQPGHMIRSLDNFIARVHPDDRAAVAEMCRQSARDASDFELEYRVVHPDGKLRWVYDKGKVYTDEGGRPLYMTGACMDITHRRIDNEALMLSEQRFGAAVSAVQGILWTNSPEGKMEGTQPGWEELTGQRYEEYQGYGWSDAVHPEDAQATVVAWNEAVRERKMFVFEHRLRRRDGSYGRYSIRAIPVLNTDGSIREWVGVHTDITEQRRAEASLLEATLRQNEALSLLESLLRNAPVGFAFFDRAYRYIRINETLAAINGLPVEAHIGKVVNELIPQPGNSVVPLIEQVFRTGQPVLNLEVHGETPLEPGVLRHWLTGLYPVVAAPGGGVHSVGIVVLEISDRIRAEEALQQSEQQLRLLSDFLPQMVWASDADGGFDFFNRRWYEFTGKGYEAMRGKGWARVLHNDDWERTWKVWNYSLQTGAYFETEFRMRRADGQYRWLLARATPFRNDQGAIVRWFGTCTDIQDQKAMAEKLEDLVEARTRELKRSNDDLQQFAHVASHDLKEPVRKIKTFASLLEQQLRQGEVGQTLRHVAKIQTAADRMFQMIEGVLTYSRLDAEDNRVQPVDLAEVIVAIETDLEVMIADTGSVIQHRGLPIIDGSPVLLYQLFYNLVNNAIKFARPGVPPRITIEADLEEGEGGTVAKFVVQDNGIGFEQEYADRIFETFARLHPKDQYEGSGLGLALCKKIVERHSGLIRAHGWPGDGATFFIRLPVRQQKSSI